MDTDAIRHAKGQGLWGDTITKLCDEVDHLNDLIDRQAEANMAKDEAMHVLAERIETVTAELAALTPAEEAAA